MLEILKSKAASRKLIVLVLWIASYFVDKAFADEIKAVVITYLGAQGVADLGGAVLSEATTKTKK